MKLKTLALLCSTVFPLAVYAADAQVDRYVVTFPQGDSVTYKGEYAANFPHGLPVGVGSGLTFMGKQGDDLIFTTVTDRGPNADSPKAGKKSPRFLQTLTSRRC